jgi:hypothetical protein
MGLSNKMKNLTSHLIVILLMLVSVFACSAEISHEYKDDSFYVYEGESLIWQQKSDPARFEVLKQVDDYLIFVLNFEPSFDVGDVWLFVFNRQKGEVSDTLKLLQLEDVSFDESGVIVNAKSNAYGFNEPGAPLWPELYRLEKGQFYKVAELQKYFDFGLLSKEAASFIGDSYLICQGKIDGCFYQSEYEKAVQLLRDLSK